MLMRNPRRRGRSQEFTVRDSTWHRVGRKNEAFILRRREAPNGVHVGGGAGGGSIDGDTQNSNKNDIRIMHTKNTVCSPFCCQLGSEATAVPATPRYHAPAETDDDGGSGTGGMAARHGPQPEFKTPEARSNGPSESFGRRSLPQRVRGESGNVSATRNETNDNGGRGDDGSENLDARRGGCFPSVPSDGQRAVGERKALYRIQLSLSAPQREAAERLGFGQALKAPTTQAAAEGDGMVTVSCSADDGCDMYQLGRMEGGGNDFAVRGPLHQSKPGGKVCGPVSRYAVRLLVDRAPPYRCRIFAGGFNSR